MRLPISRICIVLIDTFLHAGLMPYIIISIFIISIFINVTAFLLFHFLQARQIHMTLNIVRVLIFIAVCVGKGTGLHSPVYRSTVTIYGSHGRGIATPGEPQAGLRLKNYTCHETS